MVSGFSPRPYCIVSDVYPWVSIHSSAILEVTDETSLSNRVVPTVTKMFFPTFCEDVGDFVFVMVLKPWGTSII